MWIMKLTRIAPGHYQTPDGRFVVLAERLRGYTVHDEQSDTPHHADNLAHARRVITRELRRCPVCGSSPACNGGLLRIVGL